MKSHPNPASPSACGHPPSRVDDHRHESSHDGRWQLGLLQFEPLHINVKVAYATHQSPLPLAGEGSGERETVMTFMFGGCPEKS